MASSSDEQQQDDLDSLEEEEDSVPPPSAEDGAAPKWPGWPGYNVFRIVVPTMKVGGLIGRKGEAVKKMCEETGAKIRVLDGPNTSPDRVVLVSGKDEPGEEISPAMDAMLRVFKRVNEIPDDASSAVTLPVCSARLLVASVQAVSLIGRAGVIIQTIQEESSTIIKVLPGGKLPLHAGSDERLIDIEGDSSKVLKGLELVMGHLRKFLVDPSVIPLFDKIVPIASAATAAQDRAMDAYKQQPLTNLDLHSSLGVETSLPLKSDFLLHDRDSKFDLGLQHSSLSLYGQDPATSGLRSSVLGHAASAVITNMTQTMQIPLSYAEDIIGVGGVNIAYIRRTSGAILSIQETRGVPDEVTVEIKGSSTQVQAAQQLIQESISGHRDHERVREPAAAGYGNPDHSYHTSYPSQYEAGPSYPFSSMSHLYERYGSHGGGYGSYRY